MESLIDEHYKSWNIPEENEYVTIDINIYYPLAILQGQLFSAKINNKNELDLTEVQHMQYYKEVILPQKGLKMYHIDVITESYITNYLNIIESEIIKIKKAFHRKKIIAETSIIKLIEEAKNLKPETYREILEF